MIETQLQKLIRQNKQYRERIAFLENELKILSSSLTESRSKVQNLQSSNKLVETNQLRNCEGTKHWEATQLDFTVPSFLQGKVSNSFLREIKNKKKLTKEVMNLSLESISYTLKNKIDDPHGSLEHFIDVMIKEKIGYTSYRYQMHLDANKASDTTKVKIDSDDERKKRIKEENEKVKLYYKEFEFLRESNPEFMNQFIPDYCLTGLFNYKTQGTLSYNDWVMNWVNSFKK